MISQLTGTIASLSPERRYLIIVVHDVGYKVSVPTSLCEQLKNGERTTLFTYHYLREDASDLYGFLQASDVDLFEKLISVTGVGPKVALALLSQLLADDLRVAIVQGDVITLTQIPGIGKKLAERLVVELKQTLLEMTPEAIAAPGGAATKEVVEALQHFGYTPREIHSVLRRIKRTDSVSDQIKEALAHLSTHARTR